MSERDEAKRKVRAALLASYKLRRALERQASWSPSLLRRTFTNRVRSDVRRAGGVE